MDVQEAGKEEPDYYQVSVAYFTGPKGWHWGRLSEVAMVASNLLRPFQKRTRRPLNLAPSEVWERYINLTRKAELGQEYATSLAWISNLEDEPVEDGSEPDFDQEIWVPAGWIERVLIATSLGAHRVGFISIIESDVVGEITRYFWDHQMVLVAYDLNDDPLDHENLESIVD